MRSRASRLIHFNLRLLQLSNKRAVKDHNGGYFAKSSSSVYIADQTLNQIRHVDVAKKNELERFQLNDQPTALAYVESSNTLYAALKSVGNLVKIELDTGTQSEIVLNGPALSIASHADRVYISTQNATYATDSELYSVGNDDVLLYHGGINGDLIKINPLTDEVISVETDSFSAIHRYSFDVNGTVVEQQVTQGLSNDTIDVAISPDGEQLAVVTANGNAGDYTVHDISASDQSVTNGAWDTRLLPGSADFSPSGELFAATNFEDLMVFDATRRTLILSEEVDMNYCPQYYDEVGKARFSADGESVFVSLLCGQDAQHTTLFYFPVPPVPAPIAQPVQIVAPSIGQTHFTLGQSGSYYAQSLSSVFVADQFNNRIIHTNVDAGVDLAYFELTDQPSQFVYIESTNTLYASLRAAGKLVKISLDTGALSELVIAGRALAIDAYNDRVYFTTNADGQNINLYSIGDDDQPQLHGEVKGSVIKLNPMTGEIVAVTDEERLKILYRYNLSAMGETVEIQDSEGTAIDRSINETTDSMRIAFSPDGQQLAIGGEDSASGDDGVFDILASDLSVLSGFWNSRNNRKTFSFSPTGSTFAVVTSAQILSGGRVLLYDPTTYLETASLTVNTSLCDNTSNRTLDDLRFSADGQYVVTRIVCGEDDDKTVLHFNTVQ